MGKNVSSWSDITPDMCELWSGQRILDELKDSCWHSQISLAHIVGGKNDSSPFELEEILKMSPDKMWHVYETSRCSGAGISYTTLAVIEF